jgi:hypothetical protein
MTHFAKVAVALEHIVGDVACQLGEANPKVLMKWRHLFRDEVRPLYKRHGETAAPYMADLVEIPIQHSHRIQTIYAKKNETPMERYQRAIRAEGSPVIDVCGINEEGTR